jgi:hypothetical protein
VVVVGLMLRSPRAAPESPWLASRFAALAADDRPFPASVEQPDARPASLLQDYGIRLVLDERHSGAASGHDLRLLNAIARTDDAGNEYLEVRLNCCGKPVLMAVARSIDEVRAAPFGGLTVGTAMVIEGVNLAARQVGQSRVAVASRHSVGQIIDSLEPVATRTS